MKNLSRGNKVIFVGTIVVMALFIIKFIVDLILGNEIGIIGFTITGWIPMFIGSILISVLLKECKEGESEDEWD